MRDLTSCHSWDQLVPLMLTHLVGQLHDIHCWWNYRSDNVWTVAGVCIGIEIMIKQWCQNLARSIVSVFILYLIALISSLFMEDTFTCSNIHHLCTVLESALLKKSSLAFDSNSRRQELLFFMSFFGLFV